MPLSHTTVQPFVFLISGSVAMDTIMTFADRFANHLLVDKLDSLNVSFLASSMREAFGGCAGNIAYNLRLLGFTPRVCASVGKDADPYLARFAQLGIPTEFLYKSADNYTARAFITTDSDANQLTTFHPGAMLEIPPLDLQGVQLALVGPASKNGMISHVDQLHNAAIPTIFDLGQAMPLFSGDDLHGVIDKVDYLVANEYEAEVIARRIGLSHPELAEKLKAFIVTRGERGSCIYAKGEVHDIEAVAVNQPLDPTGCGDAYRAGLLYGICHTLDWQTTGRIASLIASIKLASNGTQNHSFSLSSLAEAYKQYFAVANFPQ